MIKFTLKCDNDHRFDSWFKSSEACESLMGAGMVTCAICGSHQVEKAIMAPRVRDSRSQAAPPSDDRETALSTPQNPMEEAMAELRKQVEDNSDYVGLQFAKEARDMHDGLIPERPIYGEAKPDEAAKLVEDGVPVTPLPFVPGRKTN